MNASFVPVFTSTAGSCLTIENWRVVGVNAGAFYLEDLLMKPGRDILASFASLREYCAWPGQIILNTILPPAQEKGHFKIVSRYDGAIQRLDLTDIYTLILTLKPDVALVPSGFAAAISTHSWSFPDNLTLCFPLNELTDAPVAAGVYIDGDASQDSLQGYTGPLYCLADPPDNQQQFASLWIESNQPAEQALQGNVYRSDGSISILDKAFELDFNRLAADCNCPVCEQALTCAYFHHLYQQTPLLAQRFLIQHNVKYFLMQSHLL